jgi:hypothetical protein
MLLEQANEALGRLDGIASVLPGLKEAVLSSQIS